ncbi:FtsX-like permease family protein [Peptacetobacter hiranonis]|uniref:ABC transporter permease n=1 Tax=Peptacetobacter hiranonis TaxID=89152 RepID=UPI00191720BB|nr:FtsX-like permease family protein [Peptacetobacter hiranonis]QQQ86516.1 FtsX-like permease family protein [Peptacetobacter hiranonis]
MWYFKAGKSYIKKYKNRSISIGIGIVLGIALIVGVGSLSFSAKEQNIKQTEYELGSHFVRYNDLNDNQVDDIENMKNDGTGDNPKDNIGKLGLITYYDSSTPESDDLTNIASVNRELLELQNTELVKGNFPKKANEVVIEKWVLDNLGVKPEIGQKITIDLYGRKKKETFVVSGILSDRVSAKSSGIMEIFLNRDFKKSNEKTDAYVRFKDDKNIVENIYLVADDLGLDDEGISVNRMLLDAMGQLEEIDYNLIYSAIAAAIVLAIVVYGVFNISIIQRISEYGLIRAIGGKLSDIVKLLLTELLLIWLVSLPIGVAVGYLVAVLLKKVSGNVFTEMAVELSTISVPIEIIGFASVVSLLIIVFIVVLLAWKIKRISPIDEIRGNIKTSVDKKRNQKMIRKRKNNSLSYSKIIPIEIKMAMKNVLRNKSGFAITLISMCLGSVMFLASSFYSDLMEDQQKKLDEVSKVNTDFKISMIPIKPMYAGYSAKDIDNIRSINGVEDVGEIRNLYARMFLKENQILDKEYFKEENEWTYNKDVLAGLLVDCGNGDKILKSGVYGYNDTLLKKLDKHLAKGNVNLKEMNNEEVAIAMVPKNNGKYTVGVDIGDKLKVTFREDGISSEEYFKMTDTGGKYITKEFKIVGIVNELVDYSDYYVSDNSVNLVLSNKQFEKFSGYKNAQIVNIEMKDDANREKVAKQILAIANRTSGNVFADLTEERKTLAAMEENKQMFINAIIGILFLISIINIVNNIKYSMVSRRAEFGIIRAVGADNKMFRKIVLSEGLMYGLYSGVISVIVALIVCWGIYSPMAEFLISPKFLVNPITFAGVFLMNVVLGALVSYLPFVEMRNISIVESIERTE